MRRALTFRLFSVALLALGLVGLLDIQAQDKKAASIKIAWHGQSFFVITTAKGTNIVIDPHQIMEYGRVQGVKGDIVLMSHFHNDHTQLGVIENIRDKGVRIIPGLKGTGKNSDWNLIDEEIKDVRIRSLGVYHDNLEGMRYGKNALFMLEVDGWRIVHLGDLGHLLTPAQIRKIGAVDVLMIPVGGIYALNGGEAKQVVDQLKPKEYIFPMHCGTKIYKELLPPDEFLEDQPKEKVAVSEDNFIMLNRDAQRPRPLIVQLNFWPKSK